MRSLNRAVRGVICNIVTRETNMSNMRVWLAVALLPCLQRHCRHNKRRQRWIRREPHALNASGRRSRLHNPQ
jgi:hypothetical protein